MRLRSVLLKTGPGDKTPEKVQLVCSTIVRVQGLVTDWVCYQFTQENLDFDNIGDVTPTQELEVAPGREVGEYAVKSVIPQFARKGYSMFRQNGKVLQCFFPHTILLWEP